MRGICRYSRIFLAISLIFLMIVPLLAAQTQDELPVIKDRVDNLIISVIPHIEIGNSKSTISDVLEKEHFQVFIDDVKYPFDLHTPDGSVTVVFVHDASGSMEEFRKEESAKQVYPVFARNSHELDRYALITFRGILRVWPSAEPDENGRSTYFSNNLNSIINQITFEGSEGSTSFNDAVYAALERAYKGEKPRVIILVSDGMENNSRYTLKELGKLAEERDTRIIAVCIYRKRNPEYKIIQHGPEVKIIELPSLEDEGKSVMQSLSQSTGGIYLQPDNLKEFESALMFLSIWLRRTYEISVDVPKHLRDGKNHKIRVELKKKLLPKELKDKNIVLSYTRDKTFPKL